MHLSFPPRLLAPAATTLYAVLRRSVRWEVEDPHGCIQAARDGQTLLFLCRHGQLIPLLWAMEGTRLNVLVSRSGDGDLLASLLRARGFGLARGSSSRHGVAAGRAVYRSLSRGVCVGLAADGPRGPLGVVHESILRIAQRSGVPVVGLRAGGDPRWEAPGSWDRFEIPIPGRRLRVIAGPPRSLAPGEKAIADAKQALEWELAAGRAEDLTPELSAQPGWGRL